MPDAALLITCEHAVNHIPERWISLFDGRRDVLDSHRGWDPGAMELARLLADAFSAPCFESRVSRLLVDHNRSPHNRFLWSDFSRKLPKEEQTMLLEEYYKPFRDEVGRWINCQHAKGRSVVHLSVHTFTPVLEGRTRNVDIGVLYNPKRLSEALFGRKWQLSLASSLPKLLVRRNQPYLGRSDAHLSTYRKLYGDAAYLGIELEVNQAFLGEEKIWSNVCSGIVSSLGQIL